MPRKQNPPPRQNQTAVKVKAKPRRQPRATAPRTPDLGSITPFLKCALGGHNSGVGIPDGDQRMQIVRDFRYRYTLKPAADGSLTFLVGYTPYGVLQQLAGSARTFKKTTPLSTAPAGWAALTDVTATAGTFIEDMVGDPTRWDLSPYSEHRLVSLLATCTFTGSHMNNQGSVIARNMNVVDSGTAHIQYNTNNSVTVPNRDVYRGYSLSSSSLVGAARETYSARIHPRDRQYYPLMPGRGPITSLSGLSTVADSQRCMALPITDAPFSLFHYDGLASDASITVDITVCNQCVVNPAEGSLMPFAKPALPADVTLLDRAVNFLSSSSHVKKGLAVASNALANTALRYVAGEQVRSAIMDH